MKETLLQTFEDEIGCLAVDNSLGAILADSEALLQHMKHLKEQMLLDNNKFNTTMAQKELQVKTDYFNSQTLKHEKTLNKKIKSFSSKIDTVIAKDTTIDSIYPSNFKLTGLEDKSEELSTMTLAIFLDLLYQGQFELLDKLDPLLHFSKFIKIDSVDDDDTPNLQPIYNIFKPMISISNELLNGNYIPLLNWIDQYSLKIEGIDPLYELNLITEFSILIMLKSPSNKLPLDFSNSTTLLENIKGKWYYNQYQSKLNDPSSLSFGKLTQISEVISKFRRMYTSVSNEITPYEKIPSASPIDEILTVAHISMDIFAKYAESQKSSKHIDNEDFKHHLPFEVELPHWLQHHSIFICPVSREETSLDDPPIYMPCGHMVSTDTMKRLSKNCTRNFKCPYCPQTMTSRQCIDVDIIDL